MTTEHLWRRFLRRFRKGIRINREGEPSWLLLFLLSSAVAIVTGLAAALLTYVWKIIAGA